MENLKDREYFITNQEINMMENGLMVKRKEKE